MRRLSIACIKVGSSPPPPPDFGNDFFVCTNIVRRSWVGRLVGPCPVVGYEGFCAQQTEEGSVGDRGGDRGGD